MGIEGKRNPYEPLFRNEVDHPRRDWRKKLRLRWHRLWVHRVVAVRNLVAHARYAFPERMIISDVWINNGVDLSEYYPVTSVQRDVPVVVHAPTDFAIKGTKYVEEAVQSLKAEGYKFDFRLIQGVSNREAQRIYREEADIIIDQIIAGGFGNVAVEGMFAGKPVIGTLLEEIREKFCPECPIINATVDTVKEKLAWLIENPEERARLGREGRVFVEKYCDREAISRDLWNIYKSL
jgi:glycosyltransferase involved in cell wall biosynthesis